MAYPIGIFDICPLSDEYDFLFNKSIMTIEERIKAIEALCMVYDTLSLSSKEQERIKDLILNLSEGLAP